MPPSIARTALVTIALLLGGCAGGNLGETSLLPSANQAHQANLPGGSLTARHFGARIGNALGGPSGIGKRWIRHNDVLGGPTAIGKRSHISDNDVLGGPSVSP